MYLTFNAVSILESNFRVDNGDRAFQYGDGLFETLRYQDGRLLFWADHYGRLTKGMAALQIDCPASLTADTLYGELMTLIERNSLLDSTVRLKIQVWRQTGGLYTPTSRLANILLTAQAGQPFTYSQRQQLGVFAAFRLVHSPVSAYKTVNALPYVLAGLARQTGDFDDMLLLDSRGYVAECIASALFWLRDETLYMPSLDTGCIDGILRRQLLRLAPKLGFRVQEGLFLPEVLVSADAVFCGNVMGIQRFAVVSGVEVNEKKPLRADIEKRIGDLFAQVV